MSDLDEIERLAAMQRRAVELHAESMRQVERAKVRLAHQGVCLDVFFSAELGPLYAMLNPDPRAYRIARESADRVQTAAMEAFAKL